MNVIQAVDRAKGCVQSEAKCCSFTVSVRIGQKERTHSESRGYILVQDYRAFLSFDVIYL